MIWTRWTPSLNRDQGDNEIFLRIIKEGTRLFVASVNPRGRLYQSGRLFCLEPQGEINRQTSFSPFDDGRECVGLCLDTLRRITVRPSVTPGPAPRNRAGYPWRFFGKNTIVPTGKYEVTLDGNYLHLGPAHRGEVGLVVGYRLPSDYDMVTLGVFRGDGTFELNRLVLNRSQHPNLWLSEQGTINVS